MSDDPQWKLSLDLSRERLPALEEALTALQDEEQPPTFAHFEANDAGTVWRFEAYLSPPPPAAEIGRVLESCGLAPGSAAYGPVPDKDWVAESLRLLTPVAAGRFFVHGRHDADKIPPGATSIEIEAAQAFGSGNHATTQGCLVALDDLARECAPGRVLDLGCGSGILAIAAAKLWPSAHVIAADNDPIAVEIACANAALNGVVLECHMSEGMAADALRDAAPYEIILANILMQPLIALAPELASTLTADGWLVLSGLLDEQKAAVTAAYEARGLLLARGISRQGWATLVLRRPSC